MLIDLTESEIKTLILNDEKFLSKLLKLVPQRSKIELKAEEFAKAHGTNKIAAIKALREWVHKNATFEEKQGYEFNDQGDLSLAQSKFLIEKFAC